MTPSDWIARSSNDLCGLRPLVIDPALKLHDSRQWKQARIGALIYVSNSTRLTPDTVDDLANKISEIGWFFRTFAPYEM